MVGVGALLTAIQFGYWAVLVYLPLFLSAGLLVSIEVGRGSAAGGDTPDAAGATVRRPPCYTMGMAAFLHRCVWHRRHGRPVSSVCRSLRSPSHAPCKQRSPECSQLASGPLANPQMGNVVLALAPPRAGRYGFSCDNDHAPSRLCHQHCRIGSDANDGRCRSGRLRYHSPWRHLSRWSRWSPLWFCFRKSPRKILCQVRVLQALSGERSGP